MANKCRSVMAEVIFRKMIQEANFTHEIVCLSSGLSSEIGEKANEETIKVLSEIGIDVRGHRTKKITTEEIDVWDAFFTMTKTHAYIFNQAGISQDKIYVTREDIPDPQGLGLDAYRLCRDMIIEEVSYFFTKLKTIIEVRNANNFNAGTAY